MPKSQKQKNKAFLVIKYIELKEIHTMVKDEQNREQLLTLLERKVQRNGLYCTIIGSLELETRQFNIIRIYWNNMK